MIATIVGAACPVLSLAALVGVIVVALRSRGQQ